MTGTTIFASVKLSLKLFGTPTPLPVYLFNSLNFTKIQQCYKLFVLLQNKPAYTIA